jgi:hypothetical protein
MLFHSCTDLGLEVIEPGDATGHTDRVSGQNSDEKSVLSELWTVSASCLSELPLAEVDLAERLDGVGVMGSTGVG